MTSPSTERPAPGTRSYDATVHRGKGGLPELGIYQYIAAGCCGPHGDYPMEIDPRHSWNDIEEAAMIAVKKAGYVVCGPWKPAGYAGVMTADVRPKTD